MNKFLLTLSLLVVTLTMMAVPAKRGIWKTLKLQDGTEVRAMLVGDEHGHFWRAADGQAYSKQKGAAYYTPVDAQQIAAKAKVRRQQVNARRAKRLAARRVGEVGTYEGKKKAIVLLVNFKDEKFKSTHDNALFNRIANEEGFSEGNFKGSMADYFKAQSRGLFELDFDVVGPVTVSQDASYYGENITPEDSDREQDKCPAKMVIEAVELAKEQVADWKQYDWDNDGYVDQVYVVYAGRNEADPGNVDIPDAIWPHAYSLYAANIYDGDGSGPVTVGDNLFVDSYACGSELNGDGNICGIGTMCHEYSHCLGYPDFYDIDYSGGQGMGSYDLMDAGSYNGNGYRPAGYTSYERWMAGWLEPIELNAEDVSVTNMKSLQSGGQSYIIYNKGDKNKNEFFLLENRQKDGWDASLPDKGLLILHCDYDEQVWWYNQPNDDPDHQRMTVVPADGAYAYQIYEGTKYYYDAKLFPHESVTAFNRSFKIKKNDKVAKMAAKFFNKNVDGTYWIDSSVENIQQNIDGTLSFNFVANYEGTAEEDPTESALLYESFDDCDGKGGHDNLWSGSIASGDFLPDNDGWVADNAFGANQCAKFGTSKISGSATTPEFTVSSTATLTFQAGAWNAKNDGTTLNLSVSNGTISPASVTMEKGAFTECTATITATGDVKVTFAAEKGRFFLDEVMVIDPNVAAIRTVSIHKDITTTRIYTLDGRYMGTNPAQLPRGLYIVNCKKMVVDR